VLLHCVPQHTIAAAAGLKPAKHTKQGRQERTQAATRSGCRETTAHAAAAVSFVAHDPMCLPPISHPHTHEPMAPLTNRQLLAMPCIALPFIAALHSEDVHECIRKSLGPLSKACK
jgi:hypothetical protein